MDPKSMTLQRAAAVIMEVVERSLLSKLEHVTSVLILYNMETGELAIETSAEPEAIAVVVKAMEATAMGMKKKGPVQ